MKYSEAEKILLTYRSSSCHNRPVKGQSLTGLPGLVNRPIDGLTEEVLQNYYQQDLAQEATLVSVFIRTVVH